MKKIVFILFIFILLSHSSLALHKRVYVATVEGMIAGGTEQQFEKAIDAAKDGEVLIIKLDTPGGMANAMDEIIKKISNSKTPVIIYIAPSGAQAFSAGTYILMASDIAAMAPATALGACQPRIINPATGMPEAAPQKEINAYAAKMRSLAELHGRNVSMAEKFVTENVALNEKQALENGSIDIIASNVSELLEKIDGWIVKGRKINVSNAKIYVIKWGLREKIMNYLTDPSIASLLLTIGLFGLIIGFFTPTFHLPETIGAIFIILALYGLSYIGVNAAGILLIILGIIFMIIEAHTPTFGFWTAMAIVSLIFGIMLVPSPSSIQEMPESWYLSFRIGSILIISIVAAFFAYALYKVAKAKKRKPKIGYGDLVGMNGIAITDINPDGQVKVRGEIWNAQADEYIGKGENVIVIAQERLKLRVRKA
ncbi:MAG: nodulation protein NfeD [Deltaproteobacteria bacterium]|nr:MAG: nodulation protein NfeD [Deltaproteobacteria bacterium]